MRDVICPVCEGVGKAWLSPKDSYEGNKLRDYGYCPFCEGSGSFRGNTVKGKAVKAYWDTLTKLTKEQEVRAAALAKLTAEEKKVLGL